MAVAAAAKAVKVPGSSLEDDEDFGQKMAFRPRGFPSDIPLTVGGATKQTPEKNAMVAAAVGAATYPEMDKPMSPSIPPDSFDFSVDDTPVPYLKDPPAAGMPNNLARMSREASASRFRGSPVLNSSSGSSSASDMDNGENVRTPNTKIAAFEDSKPAYKPRPSPQLDDEEVHQRGRRPRNMSRGRGRSGSVPRESDMGNQRGNHGLSGARQNGLESSIRHMSVAEDDPILTGRRGSNDHRADMYSSAEEDKSEPHGMASSTSPTGVASFDEQNPGHAKEGKDTDGVTMDPPLSSFPVVSAASEQARDSNHVAQEATAVENEDDDIDLGINLDGMLSLSSKGTKDKNTDKNKKDKADKKKKDKSKKPKKGLAKLSDERDETLTHSRNKTPASPNKAESTPRRRKRGTSVSSEKSTRGPVAGIRKGISRRLGLKKKDNEKKDPSSDDDRTETNAGNDEPEEEQQQQQQSPARTQEPTQPQPQQEFDSRDYSRRIDEREREREQALALRQGLIAQVQDIFPNAPEAHIDALLEQGYDVPTITTMLLSAGDSPFDLPTENDDDNDSLVRQRPTNHSNNNSNNDNDTPTQSNGSSHGSNPDEEDEEGEEEERELDERMEAAYKQNKAMTPFAQLGPIMSEERVQLVLDIFPDADVDRAVDLFNKGHDLNTVVQIFAIESTEIGETDATTAATAAVV